MTAPPERKGPTFRQGPDQLGGDLHLDTRNRAKLQATPAARQRLRAALWAFPWSLPGWPVARIVQRAGRRWEVLS